METRPEEIVWSEIKASCERGRKREGRREAREAEKKPTEGIREKENKKISWFVGISKQVEAREEKKGPCKEGQEFYDSRKPNGGKGRERRHTRPKIWKETSERERERGRSGRKDSNFKTGKLNQRAEAKLAREHRAGRLSGDQKRNRWITDRESVQREREGGGR